MGKTKSKGRPDWFKMQLSYREIVEACSNDIVGKALKGAFAYFDDGEALTDKDGAAKMLYLVFKASIDEAIQEYYRDVENGKAGARKRWGDTKIEEPPPLYRNSPPIKL